MNLRSSYLILAACAAISAGVPAWAQTPSTPPARAAAAAKLPHSIINVQLDPAKLAKFGLSTKSVASCLSGSNVAGKTAPNRDLADAEQYNIRIRISESGRDTAQQIRKIVVGYRNGSPVYLGDIAKITEVAAATPAAPATAQQAAPSTAMAPGAAQTPPVGGSQTPPAVNTTPGPQHIVIGALPPPPPPPTGPVMSLDDVIADVLADNPTVVQSRLTAQRAHAMIGEATGQGLPQVRVGGADTYSSIATNGVSAASTPTITPVVSTPIITDSAAGSLSPGVSQPLSSTAVSTTGSGSSTSPTIAPTITPVGTPASGGTTSTTTPTTSGASSSSGSDTGDPQDGSITSSRPEQTTTTTTPTTSTTTLHHNNYDATGSVSQFVDLFGLVHANVDASKQYARFYDLDLNRIEDDEALNTKDVYFGVIKAQSDVASAQEQLTNANATLDNAQINFNAGASPQFDVISAQAAVASAQANLISSQNELDIEKANLNNLLARPIESPVNVAPVAVVTVPSDTSTDQAVATTDQDRPEVQESTLTEKIAGNLAHLAHAGLLPSLGVTGAAVYQPYLSTEPGFGTPSHYTETLTASLSVPLFDGGVTAATVKAAQLNEATQISVRTQILNDVALEVKSALVNVIGAQSLVTADQSAVTADREALRIAGISYQAGAGTLLEVTNAEANLAVAEANLNSAVYQQQTAYAALLRAEGTR